MQQTRLARSDDGTVVHRSDCRHARVPWRWADDYTDHAVVMIAWALGYSACEVCKPFGEKENTNDRG